MEQPDSDARFIVTFVTCKAHKPCRSPSRVIYILFKSRNLRICILCCPLSAFIWRFTNVYDVLLTYTDVLLTSLHFVKSVWFENSALIKIRLTHFHQKKKNRKKKEINHKV